MIGVQYRPAGLPELDASVVLANGHLIGEVWRRRRLLGRSAWTARDAHGRVLTTTARSQARATEALLEAIGALD